MCSEDTIDNKTIWLLVELQVIIVITFHINHWLDLHLGKICGYYVSILVDLVLELLIEDRQWLAPMVRKNCY